MFRLQLQKLLKQTTPQELTVCFAEAAEIAAAAAAAAAVAAVAE
jgi:hypothetical protein